MRKGTNAEAWTSEEMGRLYKAVGDECPALLPLVVFLANTGCRKAEALALRWQDVDLERAFVRIRPYDDAAGGFDTKSGEPRDVPISETLRPWLEAPRGSDTWVFPVPRSLKSKTGKPQPRRYATFPKRQFAEAVRQAGLQGGPHKLRHTFASHFLAQVPDLFLLAKIMGHSYARVTELYGHLLPDHLSRARGAVELMPEIGAAAFTASQRWKTAAGAVDGGES